MSILTRHRISGIFTNANIGRIAFEKLVQADETGWWNWASSYYSQGAQDVGRKNFYGNHSDRAAQAMAIFYSVIATCNLHKIDAKKFLKRYLTVCAQSKTRTLSKE